MALLDSLLLIFVAGLLTALATGIGAPFFLTDNISDRWNVALWGFASGIMVSASVFGLVREGLAEGTPLWIADGLLTGVVLVVVSHYLISAARIDPPSVQAGRLQEARAYRRHPHRPQLSRGGGDRRLVC